MLKHGDLISFILVCIAIIMMGVSSVLACRTMNQMSDRITVLENQNENLLAEYELQKEEIQEIKSLHATYASETDAKLNILVGDLQDVKLEKEVKDVELHQEEEEQPTNEKSGMTLLGEYTLTAYEYTGNPCADGSTPTEWYSVACNDPALWHKKIYIEGYGDFYVCDTGGMPSYNILDIYLGDVSACYDFGVRSATVWVYD